MVSLQSDRDGVNAGATRPLRVLAVTRKPDSASFQQRVLGYTGLLAAQGVEVETITLPASAIGQWRALRRLRQFDGIWWHRHMLSSWLHTRLPRQVPIMFDFDDPLPFSSRDGGRPSASRARRFARMLGRCDTAMAASDHLAELARPHCPRVTVVPMAIDLPAWDDRPRPTGRGVELLWVGSRSTQPYLCELGPVFEALASRVPGLRLRLVAHEPMRFGAMPIDFRPWSPQQERDALAQCHIGLCPMPDTVWTRGKCPYKVVQYMAHGMAWVGSAVGENRHMAGDANEPRGLCAMTTQQWISAIESLAADAALRQAVGLAARRHIETHHARPTLAANIAALFRQRCKPR